MTSDSPVLLVAGARPNFVKVAPVHGRLRALGRKSVLVHTGQHYDVQMSGAFWTDLNLPEPDYFLGVGSASHAVQTARLLEMFEPVLLEVRPAWVVVVGDVNSTLACALVAAKLRPEIGCRIAHVEAGLRSNDWRMPEEVNRVLTDRLADLLFTPSVDAEQNLVAEGIARDRIRFVGNVMIDTLLTLLPSARQRGTPARYGLTGQPYAVVTLHRPSNVDDPASLATIVRALGRLGKRLPIVFPVHPRTRARMAELGLGEGAAGMTFTEPLGYLDMLSLTAAAALVLTDSGGLQEETTVLGVPCVTLREQTERPVTVTLGTNRLVRWPLGEEGILQASDEALARGRVPAGSCPIPGWDGHAAERVAAALHEGR